MTIHPTTNREGIWAGLPTYPEDWGESPLGDLVDINSETLGVGTPGEFTFRYIDLSSVNCGVTHWDSVQETTFRAAPSRARRRVREGDVLFGTVRPSLQSHTSIDLINGSPLVASTGFAVLRAGAKSIPRFIKHLIFSEQVKAQVHRLETGSNYPAVNESDLREVLVPHPDTTEQVLIAEVLDTLDEAIRGTEILIEKLVTIQQGLLLDTFEAMVRSKAVPLGYYLQNIEGGKSPDCPEKPAQWGDWGVLKVSAVLRSGFRSIENKAVLNPVHFNTAYEVHSGDLLITRANTYDLIAQACVVRETPPRLMLCDKTLRLKPNTKASADFLNIGLTTPSARSHIEINATGSSGTMKNITQGAIRTIPVPDLDRETQDKLTTEVTAMASRIEAETAYLNKLQSLKTGLASDLLDGCIRVPIRAILMT